MEKITEEKRVCCACGKALPAKYKKASCRNCRMKIWLYKNGPKIAAVSAAVGFIYSYIKTTSDNPESTLNNSSNPQNDSSSDSSHGRQWNAISQNWELDGQPYTYRVTYTDRRDGQLYTHDYTDVDYAYEDYEYYDNQYWTKGVTFAHIPPSTI